MIREALHYVTSAISSFKKNDEHAHHDIFGRVIEHAEEFFYPQKFRGIPVFDTVSIMRHYQTHIAEIKKYTDIGDHRKTEYGTSMFDELYTNVIRRYIEYIHMIPASEDHHHAQTGGLLVHSLEASIAALRYAKERKFVSTGMIDIDKQQEPVMHYCVWLAALLHDAGKIMRDVSINATETIHPLTKRPIKITDPILSWRPQKESLIAWATENSITAYSVSFINSRTHNRHNIDSAQILNPLLIGTFAQEFILSSPLHYETYSELCRVLSGYTKSKDYLSQAVRYGDAISTGRNVGIQYDRTLGTRLLSTATRIYRSIQMAKKDWDWNIDTAHGWIIGDEVFLRWTSAIDSIINQAQKSQMSLPPDARNVLTIMENNGLSSPYDKDNRIIKFTPGIFSIQDLVDISKGRRNIVWYSLIKMRGREMVFGTDPMPDPVTGLIYLPETETFINVDDAGNKTIHTTSSLSEDKTEQPENEEHNESDESKVAATQLASKTTSSTTEIAAKPQKQVVKKSIKREIQKLPENTHPLNATDFKGLKFKNMPTEAAPSLSSSSESTNDQSNTESHVAAKKKRNPRSSKFIKSLIDANAKYHIMNNQCFLDLDWLSENINTSFKDICSELGQTGELDVDLNNPYTKTRIIEINGHKVKTLPLVSRLTRLFSYQEEQQLTILEKQIELPSEASSEAYSFELVFKNSPEDSLPFFLSKLEVFKDLPITATADGINYDPVKLTVLLRTDVQAKKVLRFTALNSQLKQYSRSVESIKNHKWISNSDLLRISLDEVAR